MTTKRQQLGELGESLAIEHLKQVGYRIVEKNFKNRLGEIDIIAQDEDTLCFIEVKTRTSNQFGTPFEAVSHVKQHKLSQMAFSYLKSKQLDDVLTRFDIIAVNWLSEDSAHIELLKNAFEIS